MKTWERLLLDNPPFYPDSSTDEEKMRFMFLLEDGRLVGDSEGRNHRDLMGWTTEDGDSNQIEQNLCKQNKALRVCFQPFSLKQDGTERCPMSESQQIISYKWITKYIRGLVLVFARKEEVEP